MSFIYEEETLIYNGQILNTPPFFQSEKKKQDS